MLPSLSKVLDCIALHCIALHCIVVKSRALENPETVSSHWDEKTLVNSDEI